MLPVIGGGCRARGGAGLGGTSQRERAQSEDWLRIVETPRHRDAGGDFVGAVMGQPARAPRREFFALLADNSQSLQIKDAGEPQSRGDILRKTLTTDATRWQSALEENFQVRRYTFDSRLQNTRDFSELNLDGRASSLGNALKTSMERWRGQPVAGMLLFTDGNATDLGAELPALDGCPPIYPVILGKDTDVTDVSLKKVGVSQTAFEDAPG